MNDKVTKIRLAYPENMEPNLCEPEENEIYRYLLGRMGKKAIGCYMYESICCKYGI